MLLTMQHTEKHANLSYKLYSLTHTEYQYSVCVMHIRPVMYDGFTNALG